MSLDSHLQNLRAKPEHARRRIAFWWSFGLTAVIFTFWLASFSALGVVPASGTLANTIEKTKTPGESMVAAAGSLFGTLKDRMFGPKKVIYSSVEVMPGE